MAVRGRVSEPAEVRPVGETVRNIVGDAQQLARLEMQLAVDEVRRDAVALRTSAIVFGIAVYAAIVGTSLLLVGLVLALGGKAWLSAAIGGGLAAVAGVLVVIGLRALPRKPFDATRSRLQGDVRTLKEQLA